MQMECSRELGRRPARQTPAGHAIETLFSARNVGSGWLQKPVDPLVGKPTFSPCFPRIRKQSIQSPSNFRVTRYSYKAPTEDTSQGSGCVKSIIPEKRRSRLRRNPHGRRCPDGDFRAKLPPPGTRPDHETLRDSPRVKLFASPL